MLIIAEIHSFVSVWQYNYYQINIVQLGATSYPDIQPLPQNNALTLRFPIQNISHISSYMLPVEEVGAPLFQDTYRHWHCNPYVRMAALSFWKKCFCFGDIHPSHSDAGWNPTWSRVLSEKFDPAVNNWWVGLCFGINRYWAKSNNKCVVEPQPFKWTNKWVFNATNKGLVLGGNNSQPAFPVDF